MNGIQEVSGSIPLISTNTADMISSESYPFCIIKFICGCVGIGSMKAEAPPVAEKARASWRSGQNFSAHQAEKILGTASGHAVVRLPEKSAENILSCYFTILYMRMWRNWQTR